jgi:hypothetical protein
MNITLRSFCAASLLACTVSAFADDIYYKSSTTDKLNQEAYKFTEATTAAEKAEGKTVYQLMVPHITSGFYLLDGETTLGTTEAATLAQTQVTTDGVTYTLTEASDSSNPNLISPVKVVTSESTDEDTETAIVTTTEEKDIVTHVLLQLTKYSNGNTYLEVLKPTNDNIREGVPTFLYISKNSRSTDEISDPDPAARLVKGTGNHYIVHFDTYGSWTDAVRIIDPTYTDLDGNIEQCINLGVRTSNTGIVNWGDPYFVLAGTDFIDTDKAYIAKGSSDEYVEYSLNTQNYVKANMYQGTAAGSMLFQIQLSDIDFVFEYDIATNSVESNPNNNIEFEDTEDKIYNGVLYIFYGKSFVIKDVDGNSTVLTKTKTDGDYDVYSYTFSASADDPYTNAFIIEGYNTSTDIKSSTTFSGDTTDENIATDYNYNGTTMNLDTFTTDDAEKTPVVDAEELLYYYVNSTSNVTVKFYYNSSNPSASKIVVEVAEGGTMTGSAAIEVSDSECEVEYYNLNGVRVNATTPGLYIRRQGKQVSKVVIR